MKITSETLPERQVKLQIEVDEERHAKAIEQAYKRLAPRVRIPGFRPGKAPRSMIEKQLGRHILLDEAADLLLPELYKEALAEQDLNPVDRPAVEILSEEPLIFTATIPLPPEIDLGDYANLRVERPDAPVPEEQYTEAMTDLRRRYGTIEPVDRPAQAGDVIRGNVRAESDGGVIFSQDDIEYRLTEESLASLPGLLEAVIGLSKGAEVDVEHEVPLDVADGRLAGKTVKYHIVVSEVKEEKLAEEDDAFAKGVGEGFESIQALRDRIRADLQEAADNARNRDYESQILDELLALATLEYPQVLLEHEIDHILEEEANLDPRDQRAQELYLQRLGKSEAEVRDLVRAEAELRLKRSLVLVRFAGAENISVEDAEVDEELQKLVLSSGEQGMALMRLFDTENGRDTLRRSLLTRKTLARLAAITSGEAAAAPAAEPASDSSETDAPAETAPAEEAEATQPKARRAGPRRNE